MAWLRDSRAPAGALGSFIHDPVADANRLISGSPSGTQRARLFPVGCETIGSAKNPPVRCCPARPEKYRALLPADCAGILPRRGRQKLAGRRQPPGHTTINQSPGRGGGMQFIPVCLYFLWFHLFVVADIRSLLAAPISFRSRYVIWDVNKKRLAIQFTVLRCKQLNHNLLFFTFSKGVSINSYDNVLRWIP